LVFAADFFLLADGGFFFAGELGIIISWAVFVGQVER
jgi:hypothetical protein